MIECNEILKYISSSIYYMVYNFKQEKLEEFKLIQSANYTGWEKDKFNVDFVLSHIPEDEIESKKDELKALKEKDHLILIHRFLTPDDRFVFIRSKINVVKRDDERVYCVGVNEDVTKEKECQIAFEKIDRSPHVGILIFREKVVFQDRMITELLECNCIGKELTEFVKSIPLEEYKAILSKRLRGEDIYFYRENVEIFTNKRIFVNAFVQTVIFEGKYSGMALVVDNTLNYKKELIEKIINSLSNKLPSYKSKKEFFNDFNQAVKNVGYKLLINKKHYKDITIENDGKELIIPLEDITIKIVSDYPKEFDEKLIKEYKKLQTALIYALTSIEKNRLLHILKEAIEKSYQWVLITNSEGEIIYVNDTVVTLSGYSKEELIGKNPKVFQSTLHPKRFYTRLWIKIKKEKKIFEDIFVEKRKDGSYFYLKLKIVPVEIDDELFFVALGLDITKEKELEENLLKDDLTQLPNRKGFLLYSKDILKQGNYALMLIDIRNFKAINQINGVEYGNKILKDFSSILKKKFHSKNIARIGADEFVVLVEIKNSMDIYKIIDELLEDIKALDLSINIGISLYPKDATDILELIEKATIALAAAKKEGENRYEFYNSQFKEDIKKLIEAKNLIYHALKNDEFEYFFQPYFDIKKEEIVGAESLIRIVKDNEVISPYKFIEYAEKSGIILEIEEKMLEKIPYYIHRLNLPISFNVSAISIQKEHIQKILNLDSRYLTIELTERVIAQNFEDIKYFFNELKKRDFKIAIDDFGTGYSSLNYIKELEFDILKIDMSFIKNITTSQKDLAIVKTILTLAKTLNYKTIAEGVETIEQYNILKELGCDIIQGYLISPPLPLEEFIEFKNKFDFNSIKMS